MDREPLVEKMTESAAQGLHEAIFGVGVWQRILPGERAQWCGYVRAAMRAALAVAEPAVREWERATAPAIGTPLKLPTLPRVASAQFTLSDEAKRDIEVINAHTRRTGGTP